MAEFRMNVLDIAHFLRVHLINMLALLLSSGDWLSLYS
jgi:hypothetical protein